MLLFKASGATYRQVVAQSVHAFRNDLSDATPDQFVLLSKNRQDCRVLEKQVQYVAKLLKLRSASAMELDALFPGVGAGERWANVVELYWVRPVPRPFNLSDVRDFNYRHYDTVQGGFAQLRPSDRTSLLAHFLATNRDLLFDVVNDAERPGER